MEAFILYIYICSGGTCQMQAQGVYERSLAYSKEIVNGSPSKAPMYTGEQMCERAAEKLQLKKPYWQCINSGLHK